MPTPYSLAKSASYALHAPDWHATCLQVQIVDVGGFPCVWCPDCRCFARLESVSSKVDLKASSVDVVTAGIVGGTQP